jgi:hypothetical protein
MHSLAHHTAVMRPNLVPVLHVCLYLLYRIISSHELWGIFTLHPNGASKGIVVTNINELRIIGIDERFRGNIIVKYISNASVCVEVLGTVGIRLRSRYEQR